MSDQARMHIPVFAVALAALGCHVHEVPRAPRYVDRATKMSAPAPGQARLYVYRMGSLLDFSYFSISVAVSGKHLGEVGREDYVKTDLSPGHYVLSAKILDVRWGPQSPARAVVANPPVEYPIVGDLQLELAGDRVYFDRVETRRFWPIYPPTVVLMDEAKGRKQVEECKLVDPAYVRPGKAPQ